MNFLQPVLALAVVCLPCAGVAQVVASICTSTGNATEGHSIETHYADGRMVSVVTYPVVPQTTVIHSEFAEPVTDFIWGLAEPLLAQMPEVDAVPCDGGGLRTIEVVFSDGARERRATTCRGGPFDDFMFALITGAPTGRSLVKSERTNLPELLDGTSEGCGTDW